MSEVFGNNASKKEILKRLIKELHDGKHIEEIKARRVFGLFRSYS